MLTLPKIVERPAQPYIAIREQVSIPFEATIDRVIPELMDRASALEIEAPGPIFFKYNVIRMPELEVEFGVPTTRQLTGDERLLSGVLPAGRYAKLTYWGHYDNLMEVTALLIGWAKQKGLRWDVEEHADGEHFACRLESYINDPAEEPDPDKWETVLEFRLADGQ